jgi:exoribonuclease-2
MSKRPTFKVSFAPRVVSNGNQHHIPSAPLVEHYLIQPHGFPSVKQQHQYHQFERLSNPQSVMMMDYPPITVPPPVPFISNSNIYQPHHHNRTAPHPFYDHHHHRQLPPQQYEESNPSKKGPTEALSAPKKSLIGARFYRSSEKKLSSVTSNTADNSSSRTHQLKSNRSILNSQKQQTRNINTFRNMVVEYENSTTGLRQLGVIVSPHQVASVHQQENNKWKLIDSNGESTIVDSRQLTYQWSSIPIEFQEKVNISEDVRELERQCLHMADQHQEKAEIVWQEFLTSRSSIEVSCQDLAAYLFKSQSPACLYAAYRFLYMNPMYFNCKKSSHDSTQNFIFECRSIREVEELKKIKGEVRENLIRENIFLIKMANELLAQDPNDKNSDSVKFHAIQSIRIWQPEFTDASLSDIDFRKDPQYTHFIKDITSLCLNQPAKSNAIFEKFLKPFGVINDESSIAEFCMTLKLFDTPNIHLLRSNIVNKTGCPLRIQELANNIKQDPGPDIDMAFRRDLTHLQVFTIDSYPETVEIDDGISLEVVEDGREYVYIHIADATRFIKFGTELDVYASQTTTSIYLPDCKISMLPKELSVDMMSLSDARQNYVLTFKARVLPDGELAEYDVFPAIVNKVKKIDYDETDHILANLSSAEQTTYEQLKRLLDIANIRFVYRMRHGAFVSFTTPKPEIKVQNSGAEINVTRSRDGMSYSRRMIQEFMIIANQVSAKFAAERGITIPYRGTSGGIGGGSGVISDLPSDEDIERALRIDINMSEPDLASLILSNYENFKTPPAAACITQTPSWHGGIGVSEYTQATSPIRRYSDLLVHYQLKASIRGDNPPLSWDMLEHLLITMEPTVKIVNNLQKQSEKFWLFKYFKNQMKYGRLYRALVLDVSTMDLSSLRPAGLMAFIYLMEIGFKTHLYATTNQKNKIIKGEYIDVRVGSCDPFAGTIEFQLQ